MIRKGIVYAGITAFVPTLAIKLAEVPTGSNSKSFYSKRSVHVCKRPKTALYMGSTDSILSVTIPPHISDQKNCTLAKHSQYDIFLRITIWNTY